MAESERFELRVSPEWLAQVDKFSGMLSRAGFVKKAVMDACARLEASHPEGAVGAVVPDFVEPKALEKEPSVSVPAEQGASVEAGTAPSRASRPMFHCPVAGCLFAASSPSAICNVHGRKLRA